MKRFFTKKISVGVSVSRLFSATVVMNILAVISITIPSMTYASERPDNNVHPTSCVAPFLSQAFGLRWHEHYLMNPASNRDTWVICPLNFHNDEMPDQTIPENTFRVNVYGAMMDGASSTPPSCFFTVYDGENNTQQPPYITNGSDRRFTLPLTTSPLPSMPDRRWSATRKITLTEFESVATARNDRSAAVFCKLNRGYSIGFVNWID